MVFPYPEGSHSAMALAQLAQRRPLREEASRGHDDSVKQSYREPMEEPSAAWEAPFC